MEDRRLPVLWTAKLSLGKARTDGGLVFPSACPPYFARSVFDKERLLPPYFSLRMSHEMEVFPPLCLVVVAAGFWLLLLLLLLLFWGAVFLFLNPLLLKLLFLLALLWPLLCHLWSLLQRSLRFWRLCIPLWGRRCGCCFPSLPFLLVTIGGAFSFGAAATTTTATTVVVVGRIGDIEFFAGHALDMCPKAPQDQQYGLRPSITTNIRFSWHVNMFGIFRKAFLVNVTCTIISPVAIPDLFMIDDTSSACPYFEKKAPRRFSHISTGMNCNFCPQVAHVFRLKSC